MSVTCPKCCELIDEKIKDEQIEKFVEERENHYKIKCVEAKLDGREPPSFTRHNVPVRFVCRKCSLILEEVYIQMGGYGKYVRATEL